MTPRPGGNRTYYRAATSHPLCAHLRGLVVKTSGVVDVLHGAMEGSGARAAFVFGSVAAGTEKAVSGVDLMVVGTTSLRQVARRISEVVESIGREVYSHVMTEAELAEKRRRGDRFMKTVLAAPRPFVIGGERELEAVS